MAIRSVLKRGDPRLHQPCQPVTDIAAVRDVITDLRDTLEYLRTLYQFSRGAGISANQIGYTDQVCTIIYNDVEYVLINPRVAEHSDDIFTGSEGCLSFFDYRGQVPRWRWLQVEALDEFGHPYRIRTEVPDFSALLQHELDHLAGRLYISRQSRRWWRLWLRPRLHRKRGVPAIP